MEIEQIKKSILEIRGKKVMLDMDLAIIYEVETRVLKQAVRRNINRFPDDFMFELSKEEWDSLRSQIVMFKTGKGNFPKYLPFAFTEQGVAMLSAVLNSQRAVQTSVQIMRAFVLMRQFALSYQELSEQLQALEKKHNQKFDDIEQVLKHLIQKDKQQTQQMQRKQVGYKK
jgi:adenine-specific DNA methylase